MFYVEVLEDIGLQGVFNIISMARGMEAFQCKQNPALW